VRNHRGHPEALQGWMLLDACTNSCIGQLPLISNWPARLFQLHAP